MTLRSSGHLSRSSTLHDFAGPAAAADRHHVHVEHTDRHGEDLLGAGVVEGLGHRLGGGRGPGERQGSRAECRKGRCRPAGAAAWKILPEVWRAGSHRSLVAEGPTSAERFNAGTRWLGIYVHL